jgi:hypothetical protein
MFDFSNLMRSRDHKGRFIKIIQKKQKRNQNLKGVEEMIIKEDIFKRKISLNKYLKNMYFLIYSIIWKLKNIVIGQNNKRNLNYDGKNYKVLSVSHCLF